jgi:hypothetical protein
MKDSLLNKVQVASTLKTVVKQDDFMDTVRATCSAGRYPFTSLCTQRFTAATVSYLYWVLVGTNLPTRYGESESSLDLSYWE